VTLQLGTLTLRNVRSYESATLAFGPGVTVLTGDVGSGKTSLLHAIEMALFGFAEVDAPYLVRHRTGDSSVSLTLSDGEHAYELARTFRRKTRRGREVFDAEEPSFRVDGELRTYSLTEFRQRVIELLGFPDNPNPRSRSDLWRWAVYTPQERMREILDDSEADARLATIRKALGLERYRLAADNAEVVASAIRARGRSHSDVAIGMRHFEEELAKAEEDRTSARAALSEAEAAAADARRLAAETEELLAHSESDRRRREGDRRHLEQLERDSHRLGEALQAAERRVEIARREARAQEAAANASEVSEERRAGAERIVAAAELELRSARAAAEDADRRAHELIVSQTAEDGVARTVRQLETALAAELEERQRAASALADAESRGPVREPVAPTNRTPEEIVSELRSTRVKERAAAELAAVRKSEARELSELLQAGRCPRCHQTVRPEEFADHRAEAERGANAAEDAVRALGERLGSLESERGSRERYDRARQAWVSREELCAATREALGRASARLEERERLLATARAELEAAAQARDEAAARAAATSGALERRARADGELDRARSARTELEKASVASERARASAVAAQGMMKAETDRLTELQEQESESRAAIAALSTGLEGAAEADRTHAELLGRRDQARRGELGSTGVRTAAAERLGFAEQRRAAAERGVAERRRHVDEADRLTRTAAFVAGPFRDALLDLERRLLGRAQAAFERDFARAFSVLVEDPGLVARCSPTFVPYVEIDGEMTPAAALSGGERTALALAFRLALGDVVRAAGRLRLDVIVLDEPTDGFSPEQVVRMGELLRTLPWGQVIVVTHEAGLAGIADASVRVRKDGGISHLEGTGAGPVAVEPAPRRARRRASRLDAAAPPAT